MLVVLVKPSVSLMKTSTSPRISSIKNNNQLSRSHYLRMVALDASSAAWSNNRNDRFLDNMRNDDKTKRRVRKKYKRKRVPETEKERKRLTAKGENDHDNPILAVAEECSCRYIEVTNWYQLLFNVLHSLFMIPSIALLILLG